MYRVVLVAVASVVLSTQAEARRHPYPIQYFRQSMAMAPSDERVVGNRPSGCPNAFCGCEASLYRFGHIVPELNLAGNWRRFPRAAPAPGMAAVRSGHVMILQQQVAGDVWYVHDGNSGGHVTREHPRSIAGYAIVDPSAGSALSSGTLASSAPPSRVARQARAPSPMRVARLSPSQNGAMTPLFAN
jgi:hypothetical protein